MSRKSLLCIIIIIIVFFPKRLISPLPPCRPTHHPPSSKRSNAIPAPSSTQAPSPSPLPPPLQLTPPQQIIIVGAGLGGLGAAISLLLAGHAVTVLEGASQIGEVGAGIQCLPNSSRILLSWGLGPLLSRSHTQPRRCNMLGWKGNALAHMDFHTYAAACGTPFWDFHRANLHAGLLERAAQLGAAVRVDARVVDVVVVGDGAECVLQTGERVGADVVVGADGINSRCREILLGREDPPVQTGDLAYRLLLSTKEMVKDPELRGFVEDPQVNYWMGPDAHAGESGCWRDFCEVRLTVRSELRLEGRRAVQYGAACAG